MTSPTLQEIWEFLSEHWELLTGTTSFLGLVTGLVAWVGNHQKNRRKRLVSRAEAFPFEVIQPRNSNLLQQLFKESNADLQDPNDPLSDFNIPYQPRKQSSSVRQELEKALDETGWLLVLGGGGLGKTREAAELAWTLNNEGWTILKYNRDGGWLDVPSKFPGDSCSRRKLLFFLDNLDKISYSARKWGLPPGADDPSQPLKVPFQERLLRVLDFFELECGADQIRVIAIADNDSYRDLPDSSSDLNKLEFNRFSKLWKRFCQYHLPEPEDQAIIQLLTDVIPKTRIQSNIDDYPKIAQRNDRTFHNVIENLRRLQNRSLPLTLDTFTDTLEGTWRDRYKGAVKRYRIARYIYDAVELLQSVDVALDHVTVSTTARMLSTGNAVERLWNGWKIHFALNDLIKTERILEPRVGQIEAKEYQLQLDKWVLPLYRLLMRLTNRKPHQMLNSMFNFANTLDDLDFKEEAIAIYKKILKFKPDYHETWNNLGRLQHNLGHYEEAIVSYDQATKIKPDKYQAWDARGIVLNKLREYEKAIASYDMALSVKPDDSQTLYNRGNTLYYLGQFEEAIADWKRAGEINSGLTSAFFNQACVYARLGDVRHSLENLEKALQFNPDKYRKLAKEERDFDNIRSDHLFQTLINPGV
jgi:tetratricopeptide (TPR) repeat protein